MFRERFLLLTNEDPHSRPDIVGDLQISVIG